MSDSPASDADSILACEECLSPAEAFSVVGNETRLSILEALWRMDRPAAFSDLRREVEMRDSAQFNYHLSKLTGQFVTKTDDGYDFRSAGRAVIQAVLSGTINQDPEIEPFEVAGDCVNCGAPLEAHYRNEQVRIRCTECGRPHGGYSFPPGGLEERTPEELMNAFNQRARHLSCLSADGVCPECSGRMSTHLYDVDDDEVFDMDVRVEHECQRCQHSIVSSVGLVLLDDAEIVSFYRDHGIDLNTVPYWTLEWCVTDNYTTVERRGGPDANDEWRITLTIPVEDEQLVLDLDGDLNVLDTERREARPAGESLGEERAGGP
ncbi:winged helix-turn-helix domain-containing protein [Halorarius halobius]|uniref:winged helix-turn-helix domain-containing protein n=1 Tax=Halorarius halobius TaxID=2962671 RepID=UPI0020CBDA80|nr:winged helix-turn-helix domain-containing protein [Halorarius halobius]